MSARATPLRNGFVPAPRRIPKFPWAVWLVLATLLFLVGMQRLVDAALEYQFREISQRFVRAAHGR
jgi:hypothetical protein